MLQCVFSSPCDKSHVLHHLAQICKAAPWKTSTKKLNSKDLLPPIKWALSAACVTWRICSCDMTHSCVTWPIHSHDMALSHVTWLIHVRHYSFICDMTELFMCQDSFMFDMTHRYMEAQLFMRHCHMTHVCPTQSIMYVSLRVNRFQKRFLLIVQYKYLKSCSGDFYSPESDPPHKIMRYWFYSSISWFFHFHQTTLARWKWFVPQLYHFRRGISGGPALQYLLQCATMRHLTWQWETSYRTSPTSHLTHVTWLIPFKWRHLHVCQHSFTCSMTHSSTAWLICPF